MTVPKFYMVFTTMPGENIASLGNHLHIDEIIARKKIQQQAI